MMKRIFVGNIVALGLVISSVAAAADGIFVERFRTEEEIVKARCRTATLSDQNTPNCGYYRLSRLDFIHVPDQMGQTILRFIDTAYDRSYYATMDKNDFFHGHLISMGPKKVYESPQEFYADVNSILFHSREYLRNAWDPIPDSEDERAPLKPRVPRSFFGYLNNFGADGLWAAIDLIAPGVRLMKSYRSAGTVYADNIVDSIPALTKHNYHPEDTLSIKTCEEPGCLPCDINNQLYILADPNGRWVTKSHDRIEMFLTCKYN